MARSRSARPARRSGVSLAKILIAVTLALTLGPQWAVLQSVAWARMFVMFARETSLADAWSDTFDGHHPCKLCVSVQKGREQDQRKQIRDDASGPKLAVPWQAAAFDFFATRDPVTGAIVRLSARAEPPPRPRPRMPSTRPA